MKKFVSMVSVVLLLLSVMSSCTNNYKPEYETDTETHEKSDTETETEPKLTGISLEKKYGSAYNVNGIDMYFISEISVYTTKVVPGGYTFVNIGYISGVDEFEKSIISTHWIGFDGSSMQFNEDAVLRVQAITLYNNPDAFQSYYAAIDEEKRISDSVEIFRIWIENADGSKVREFNPEISFLIDESDAFTHFKAFGIEKDGDESLATMTVPMNIPNIAEGKFLSIKTNRILNAIAIFGE